LGQQGAQEKALAENRKMFVWPDVCQKGKKLDAPFTLAYKTFCNHMGLNKFHSQSQTEFRVRVRAAWLRLVACYPFNHGLSPDMENVASYLKDAHVEEVDLQPTNASSGPRTFASGGAGAGGVVGVAQQGEAGAAHSVPAAGHDQDRSGSPIFKGAHF
jgi:hypothetical protein